MAISVWGEKEAIQERNGKHLINDLMWFQSQTDKEVLRRSSERKLIHLFHGTLVPYNLKQRIIVCTGIENVIANFTKI